MSDLTREEVIEILQSQLDTWDDIPNVDDIKYAFKYAIASLKTDEAYDIIYEGLDVIPVPEGATNGDMIKAVFGFEPRENACIIPKKLCNGNPAECDGCRFDDFWNSPYRKE